MNCLEGFPGGSDVKESACNVGDLDSTPRLGRSPVEGNGYPLQYSCLENYMERGTWQAIVHGVAKSLTPLSDFHLKLESTLFSHQLETGIKVTKTFTDKFQIFSFDYFMNDSTIH